VTSVGIIGLGAMGGAMAGALVRGGHQPTGHDIDAAALARFVEAGGRAATDAVGVAAAADLVVVVLRDEGQIEALLDPAGAVAGAFRRGSVVWVASTVADDWVVGLGKRLMSAGIHLLDGPVSGGVAQARAGKLTLMLAGDDTAFDAAAAIAPALAERVFRVGTAPGAASLIKAVNQLLTAAHIALAAEALGLAMRAGADPQVLQDVVNVSAGASRMFTDRAPRMLGADFAPNATVGIFLKDLAIALDMARRHGAHTPVALAVRDVFRRAAEAYGSDLGDTGIFQLYRPEESGRV
jgi:3-hydroxyisobutyrate dehydrogenase